MTAPIDATAVAALAHQPIGWWHKGIPPSWSDRPPAQVCASRPDPFDDGVLGPLCVLSETALAHNLSAMARWCLVRGVSLAPHAKTHMSPQLLARQFEAGAWGATVATISQVRTFRRFGVRRILLANELVDAAGLRWLAADLADDPGVVVVCWVDSVAGVESMTATLRDAEATHPLDVCVEVGMPGGRTGCRGRAAVDEVARAVTRSAHLRLVGVAGYEAALGHDVSPESYDRVRGYLREIRAAVIRLGPAFESDEVLATAGGSTFPDAVAEELVDWPDGSTVRTVVRSGCYLTHDDGLYRNTSPLPLRSALSVWAQVTSRPEPDLALLTMGRRDVSHDQGLPVPYGLDDSRVTALNDQHAFLSLGPSDSARVAVGDWLRFGISHPCTTFDKWQLIPVLDDDGRVLDLVRTFF
ncbi:alanine racemase [Mycolicibacterium sediminis]|uniref:Amino acid deaminase n=1 Tax=Mycolicibacterium sediminis TaxID=1286180 RepID=A0A7I7QIT5_9MYCO|nr:alanine racemase [Mycolicibacterium sediminis]BBY26198.1 amino acid deaminase [Mycolicibacterium sediminis]